MAPLKTYGAKRRKFGPSKRLITASSTLFDALKKDNIKSSKATLAQRKKKLKRAFVQAEIKSPSKDSTFDRLLLPDYGKWQISSSLHSEDISHQSNETSTIPKNSLEDKSVKSRKTNYSSPITTSTPLKLVSWKLRTPPSYIYQMENSSSSQIRRVNESKPCSHSSLSFVKNVDTPVVEKVASGVLAEEFSGHEENCKKDSSSGKSPLRIDSLTSPSSVGQLDASQKYPTRCKEKCIRDSDSSNAKISFSGSCSNEHSPCRKENSNYARIQNLHEDNDPCKCVCENLDNETNVVDLSPVLERKMMPSPQSTLKEDFLLMGSCKVVLKNIDDVFVKKYTATENVEILDNYVDSDTEGEFYPSCRERLKRGKLDYVVQMDDMEDSLNFDNNHLAICSETMSLVNNKSECLGDGCISNTESELSSIHSFSDFNSVGQASLHPFSRNSCSPREQEICLFNQTSVWGKTNENLIRDCVVVVNRLDCQLQQTDIADKTAHPYCQSQTKAIFRNSQEMKDTSSACELDSKMSELKIQSLDNTIDLSSSIDKSDEGETEAPAGADCDMFDARDANCDTKAPVSCEKIIRNDSKRATIYCHPCDADKESDFLVLESGKKYRRSLSIIKNAIRYAGPLDESRRQSKGRLWESRVSRVREMQHDLSLVQETVLCGDDGSNFVHVQPEASTDSQKILSSCGQDRPLPFSECYPAYLKGMWKKIGEGVYGEVFLQDELKESTVIKIIPIEGHLIVNGEIQKKFSEVLSEIVVARELTGLRDSSLNFTTSFNQLKSVRCVQGSYPAWLQDLWKEYDESKGSENDSPEAFEDNQLFITLELANGGKDLESFVFSSAEQSLSAFKQIAVTLAVGEEALEFEHRDLHWGNVLLLPCTKKNTTFILRGKTLKIPTKNIQVSLIDFTLSRIKDPRSGKPIFSDLAKDEELFNAEGDYQFDIYRLMKSYTGNQWNLYNPKTNVAWLDYLLDKFITWVRYQKRTLYMEKKHQKGLQELAELRNDLLNYDSASAFVQSKFF